LELDLFKILVPFKEANSIKASDYRDRLGEFGFSPSQFKMALRLFIYTHKN